MKPELGGQIGFALKRANIRIGNGDSSCSFFIANHRDDDDDDDGDDDGDGEE